MQEYNFINQSGCYDIRDEDDVENLEMVLQCMKNVNFTDNEIIYLLNVIAGILNLGNVKFIGGDKVTLSKDSQQYIENVKKHFMIKDT